MRNERTYNGWTNYETWNFTLWYGDYLSEVVQEQADESEEALTYGQIYEIVDGCMDIIIEEEAPSEAGFISDVLGRAIQNVDLHDIAESLSHEVEVEE